MCPMLASADSHTLTVAVRSGVLVAVKKPCITANDSRVQLLCCSLLAAPSDIRRHRPSIRYAALVLHTLHQCFRKLMRCTRSACLICPAHVFYQLPHLTSLTTEHANDDVVFLAICKRKWFLCLVFALRLSTIDNREILVEPHRAASPCWEDALTFTLNIPSPLPYESTSLEYRF